MTPEQLAELLRSNPDLRHENGGLVQRRAPQIVAQAQACRGGRLVLPYAPSVNHYWQPAGGGRQVLSAEAKRYKAAVGARCAAAGIAPRSGPVALTVHVYRPAKRGDLDNSLKALLDSLKGWAYKDDAQVVEIHAFRHDDKGNPRIEVEVT